MGVVKLAFVTPAIMRIAIPHEVLLMIDFLPLNTARYGRDTCVVNHCSPKFSRPPQEGFNKQSRAC